MRGTDLARHVVKEGVSMVSADFDDDLTAALANRCFLYRYLWRAFAIEPDREFLSVVADGRTHEECALMLGKDSEGCMTQVSLASLVAAPDDIDARLRDEYTMLFIGPAKLVAPPWESVYAGKGDLLFQESTLEVRESFRAAGYRASGYPREADDHLATELDFMATLSERALDAHRAQDEKGVRLALSRQLLFLSEHLNEWLPSFCDRLDGGIESSFSRFYLDFALLAKAVCEADEMAVGELMAV